MAERPLLDAYLDRLERELPLSPVERAAAIEEIAGHVADATADLVSRGVPVDAAERQALERLGAPQRLASDLAAAHRTPRDLLSAAGVALRITLGTGLWTYLAVVVIGLFGSFAVSAAYDAVRNVWPSLPAQRGAMVGNILLLPIAASCVAFAVGRDLPAGLAVALHRRPQSVRRGTAIVAGLMAAWLALVVIPAEYTAAAAFGMMLVPLAMVLGVLRPRFLPDWLFRRGSGMRMTLVAVVGLVLVAGLARGTTEALPDAGVAHEVFGTTPDFSAIGPTYAWSKLGLTATDITWPSDDGATEITMQFESRRDVARWAALEVEVWPGDGPSTIGGSMIGLAPDADAPLLAVPMAIRGTEITASVEVPVQPGYVHYLLAVRGVAPDGIRYLLAEPSDLIAHWNGSVLDFLLASVAR